MSVIAEADSRLPERPMISRLAILVVGLGCLLVGSVLSFFNPTYQVVALCAAVLALAVVLRQFLLVLLGILVVRILIDFYGLVPLPSYIPLFAPVIAALLLIVLFLWQPDGYTWTRLPYWWLFALWILLTAPSLRQSTVLADGIAYFINGVVSAALFWVLGVQLSGDMARFRRIVSLLTAIGSVVAVHGIIAVRTGVFLLATPQLAIYLAGKSGLVLFGSQTTRLGSFLLNPDTTSSFLAVLGLLAVGLAVTAGSWKARTFFVAEAGVMFFAQLLTLSTASFIALAAGLLVFIVLAARRTIRAALVVLGVALVGSAGFFAAFPSEARVLLRHAVTPGEWSLRLGAWETGLNAIRAHPLTGIGLGTSTYLARSVAYQSPLQTVPLAVPENSYIEIAAMSGIPVLLIFLALVVCTTMLMLNVYRLAPPQQRPLFAVAIGCIAVVCANSVAANTWTIAPTLAFVWLLIGATTSPKLRQHLSGLGGVSATPSLDEKPEPALASVGGVTG
jgi:O-antigen ligase